MCAQGVASVSAHCSALLVGAVWGCGAALVLGDWRWLLVAVWAWGVALVFAHLPWSLRPVQVCANDGIVRVGHRLRAAECFVGECRHALFSDTMFMFA